MSLHGKETRLRNFQGEIANRRSKKGTAMKGSITFKFSGDVSNYCVRILREGELDHEDFEAIAAVVEEELRLTRLIATGEIKPTLSDPTGMGQLRVHWSN